MNETAKYSRKNVGRFESQGIKQRIACVFNHSTFQGGGEISFFELIKRIDKKKFVPLIIVPNSGEIENSISELGLECLICNFPPLKTLGFGLPLLSLIKFIKFLKSSKINLIHANGSRACLYSGIAGRLLKIPMIWHVRETIQDLAVYDKLLARLSTSIIVVSKSVREKRFDKFGSGVIKKTHIVYNGVNTCRFIKNRSARQKIRSQYDVGNHILFAIVGNLIPLKGHDFFLNAMAGAKKMQPDLGIKAMFVGRFFDPNFKKRLYRMTATLRLQDNIIFKGYSDNIPAYLSACDVFVLPSKREGCSRALLEAMSIGLPVIARNISEIEEIVKSERNAILVDYNDFSQMAAAIIKLAESRELREKLGRENKKRAKANFSLQAHVDCVQRVYENLLVPTDKENIYAYCA